jgi:hypothetical protein
MNKVKVKLKLLSGDPVVWRSLEKGIDEISTKNNCEISEVTYPEVDVKELYVRYSDEFLQRNNMLEVERYLGLCGIACSIIGWDVIRSGELTLIRKLKEVYASPKMAL